MENWAIFALIAGIVLAVFGVLAFVIPALVKRGIDLSGGIAKVSGALGSVGSVIGGLQGILPDLQGFGIVEEIMKWAKEAVEAAEQLYMAHQLDGEERKQAATELVYEMLKVANVDLSPKIKKIVNGCIEAAVFALPKAGAGVARHE